jgi:phospholipid transport system substrate-binding protein
MIRGNAVYAALLATALAAGAAGGIRAQDNADGAAAYIEDVGDAAVAKLADPGLDAAERRHALNTLITEHFAVRDISRFVLARYWRTATDGEKQAFQDAFVRTLARRFAPLFEGASDDAFEIVRAQQTSGQDDLLSVVTRIDPPEGASDATGTIPVTWRLRPRDGSYRIVDVVVENVSMAITLRSDYTSAIQNEGGDVGRLVERIEQTLDNARQGGGDAA